MLLLLGVPNMATRIWLAGNGTYNNTAKWSADGITGGVSVPTASDDVSFQAGTYTVTVPTSFTINAKSFDASAATVNFTTAGILSFAIGGNFKLSSTCTFTPTITTTPCALLLKASSNNQSIVLDLNGVDLKYTNVQILATTYTGSSWTMTSSLYSSNANASFQLAQNAPPLEYDFSTAGNTITIDTLYIYSKSTNNPLNFSGSTINVNQFSDISSRANNWSGSTINMTNSAYNSFGATATTSTAALPYNNVNLTGTSNNTNISTSYINNLTITAPNTTTLMKIIYVSGTVTILGTLTCSGGSAQRRVRLEGTVQTYLQATNPSKLIVNAWEASPHDIDFYAITIAGAGANPTINRCGVMQPVTGVTGDPARNLYAYPTTSTVNWSDTIWSTAATGGTGTANVFPLPQDTIHINTTSVTYNVNAPWSFPSIDLQGTGNTINLAQSNSVVSTGGNIYATGSTNKISGIGNMYMVGDNASTINTNDSLIQLAQLRFFKGQNGSVTLLSSLNGSTISLTGVVKFNGYPLNISNTLYIYQGDGVGNLVEFGSSGVVNSTGSNFNFSNIGGDFFGTGQCTINVNCLASNISNYNSTYIPITLSFNLINGVHVLGSKGYYENIVNTAYPMTFKLTSTSATNKIKFNNFNLNGSRKKLVTISSIVVGTVQYMEKAGAAVSAQYLSVKDSNVSGAIWTAHNSQDLGNNTGWTFDYTADTPEFLIFY